MAAPFGKSNLFDGLVVRGLSPKASELVCNLYDQKTVRKLRMRFFVRGVYGARKKNMMAIKRQKDNRFECQEFGA